MMRMIRMTIESSISVKPCWPPRRSLTTSSQVLAIDVGVLSLATLLTVGAEALQDERLSVAQVNVRIAPGIFGHLSDVALGIVLARLGSARRLLHERSDALFRRRVVSVVELVE